MNRKAWFVPASVIQPTGPAARYRPAGLSGAARELVTRLTAPGDLVLDLFCQRPTYVGEIVAAGRRAVGASVNPLNLLVAQLGLQPVLQTDAITAAFTTLADSPKGNTTLQRYVQGLYRTRCPQCGDEGYADWFAWDGEANYPYLKSVHCENCQEIREGPTDEDDISTARPSEPKGLAYHYALNRAAPQDHPSRERAAELVQLYTPRNLSALMDVTMRLEGLEIKNELRPVLEGILVEAFDLCSSLDGPDGERDRPRTLRPLSRYLERNVWSVLEQGLERALAMAGSANAGTDGSMRALDLQALLSNSEPAYVLISSSAVEMKELLPQRSVQLVLVDPPLPDGVSWALSALWANWLWDRPATHVLRPYLRRRRFDWDWHQRVLQAGLNTARSALVQEGHLVTLCSGLRAEMTGSLCLAASRAGFELLGWGATPETGCQFFWGQPGDDIQSPRHPVRQETTIEQLPRELSAAAGELAATCLRERGEPTSAAMLHAAIHAGLSQMGLLIKTVELADDISPTELTSDAVERGLDELQTVTSQDRLWLPLPDDANVTPLADRIEEAVWEAYQVEPSWQEDAILRRVYDRFQAHLTPDMALVLKCINSYAHLKDGIWTRRPEDDPELRTREIGLLKQDLQELGKRLEFKVSKGRGWDIRWREGRQDTYLFAVSCTATLGRYMLFGPSIPQDAIPCLVFPGGRAELLAHKLQRDHRLANATRWEFIKFRHLRRLTAEGADRRTLEAFLRLDPITEEEGVQIPLMLGGEP